MARPGLHDDRPSCTCGSGSGPQAQPVPRATFLARAEDSCGSCGAAWPWDWPLSPAAPKKPLMRRPSTPAASRSSCAAAGTGGSATRRGRARPQHHRPLRHCSLRPPHQLHGGPSDKVRQQQAKALKVMEAACVTFSAKRSLGIAPRTDPAHLWQMDVPAMCRGTGSMSVLTSRPSAVKPQRLGAAPAM